MCLSTEEIALCVEQCKYQNATSARQIGGMSRAYALGKRSPFPQNGEEFTELILALGALVEPEDASSFRRCGVQFNSPEFGVQQGDVPADMVPRAIDRLGCFAPGLSPDKLYYEFERIHPFKDGNGRVGHIIWSMAVREATGEWPVTMPPEFSELAAVH